ncbi:2-C-methyl-D-erythritol 4-phosphate cytidylyltransferase [Colidextribacter sp. OB.20]|uniref:2-C-methyl-D-erythritol 4-phosphate cytidylyltransferase n=1 Tax=Colidextribacter sp. OB.20 TaxID=2304568 RepID=UPI00136FB82D|nr:2-C-methyl-D-erythritol 4-phosphate cytidylyltransferase [Colidextribacter sp. OB.20]NBI08523.1 2-C-methyl-D-erythritol 4-phosphate cytidylyltransferase [Colidextribacter sp. OB.20]
MAGLLSLFRGKKDREPKCAAIIVSAGLARRMGGIDKVLAPLGELPVLVHTLYAFQDCPVVEEIVVVAREDLLVEVGRICKDFVFDKVTKVVVGGEERIHSVQAGLREISPKAELIAIHDGARPLVTQEVIRDAVSRAALTGAAAPAIPLTDTIKRSEDGLVMETVDRSQLWAVQTPQVFEAGLIKGAVQKAIDDNELLTDDCGAVERLGMKVTLTQGSRENLKITTPLDLVLGEAILRARAEEGEWRCRE